MNQTLFLKRKKIVIYSTLFSIIVFWFFLFYLQIINHSFFLDQSIKNYTRFKETQGIRGKILDRNGNILAQTIPIIKLIWKNFPSKLSEKDIELINFIEKELNIPCQTIIQANKGLKYITLSNNLDFKILCTLMEQGINFSKRLEIIIDKLRIYNLEDKACHLIGYLNNLEQNGISGIEKICNLHLKGNTGLEKTIINASGKIIEKEEVQKSEIGFNIHTTIDLTMQNILEEIFPENAKGCALILDPEDGAIKAMVSFPKYNPELFLNKIDQETWNTFLRDKTLLNRCSQGLYPPASNFKLITTLALLEQKIINENSSWFCNGHIEYKGRKYHCHYKKGHGIINIREALAHSCNIPFYNLAISQKLSIDNLHHYATLLGLSEKTGFILPEEKGLVPSRAWKKKQFNQPWFQGETLSVAIGQGATLVTPLQICRAMAAIFTGELINPRILKDQEIIKRKLPISNANLSIIKQGLLDSTHIGTSKILGNLKGWEIYPKTGTAQLRKINHEATEKPEDQEEKYKHHGLSISYAKHKKVSPFILFILIENIGSSKIAALHARKFFVEYEKIMNKI